MTPEDVFDHWTHQRYMEALAAAWRLPRRYNYPSWQRKDINLPLRELVFRACRDAVAAAHQGRREEVQRWLEGLLGKFSPPPALINHGEVGLSAQETLGRETFRRRMILAHLRCVEVAIKRDWDWTSRTIDAAGLDQVAEDTGVPLGFLRDVVHALLPEADGGGQPRPPMETCTLTVLLVDTAQNGVVADLTLERLPDGTGSLYPTPELGFVYRDAALASGRAAGVCVRPACRLAASVGRALAPGAARSAAPPAHLAGRLPGGGPGAGADQTGRWLEGPQPGGRQPHGGDRCAWDPVSGGRRVCQTARRRA